MKYLLCCWVTLVPLAAQAPSGWIQRAPLGSETPGPGLWYGGGLWAGDRHGPAPTLTDSLGLGNALTGGGFHLELGYRKGSWDTAAEVLGDRNPAGQAFLTLYRSHLWYRGDRGWQGGFEQEPLVWGYGLNGGYLLGEAARPFPRLRVQSPMGDVSILGVPLGRWGWQAFMGRMENHPVISTSLQNQSYVAHVFDEGVPKAPFLMGYRVQAEFGPLMEFYMNLVDLWAGTLNGRSLTEGFNLKDYVISMLGIKDGVVEANTDFASGAKTPTSFSTKAVSASEIDVGFRLKTPILSRALKAQSSWLYLSRGSKSAAWPLGVFLKRPFHYLGKDLSFDVKNLSQAHFGTWWTNQYRYSAPTIQQPNDTVGIQAAWSRVRAGLEHFACVDSDALGFRPFTHGTYVTGFYYYGDPLGNPVAGEAITTTAKLEVDATPRLTFATTVMRGFRPFRDNPSYWQMDHPGQTPGKNRFTVVQESVAWKAGRLATVGLGASWQRQGAVLNVAGAGADAYAWFADVAFHLPAGR